jgi:hypothetical protein
VEYQIGYGKPPREHRFKPGQSGNRAGRPKGSKKTTTLLRELLDRKIEVRTNSIVRKVSVREAILTRFAEAALKGDAKCAAFLLQRYDALEEPSQAQAALPEEREIIDTYVEALLKKQNKKDMI